MDSAIENQIDLEKQQEFFKDLLGEPEDLDTILKEAHQIPVPAKIPLRRIKRKRRRRR